MRRLLALLVLVAVTAPAPAAAQRREPPPQRVRFTAAPGSSILVHGEYPPTQSSCVGATQPVLHARYRGTVEVLRASDGTFTLIGELPFEDYLKGIAEVPRDWPMEALKAQVVAARTYALNRMQDGSGSSEYDLCATTECQVYVGMRVEAGPWGERWVQAVEETAGQVLLHAGQPAVTFYSSTSPGQTFDNEEVFGGEPLPYLRGVDEPDDGASPLAHWRVEVPFDDLARFLSVDGRWPGGPIASVAATDGAIRVEGQGSRRVTLSKEDLRDALNDTASCLQPDRYPTAEEDGYRLPQTVPSRWYRAEPGPGSLVLDGRGWGHGVGMVQWGAYGKAERGMTYDQILAAYYGGLVPQPGAVPGTIRILVADDLTGLTLVPDGDVTMEPPAAAGPPWQVASAGRGVRVSTGPQPPPALEATAPAIPRTADPTEPMAMSLELSNDASVSLTLTGRGQDPVATAAVPVEEEQTRFSVPLPSLPEGRYEVTVTAADGVDTITLDLGSVRLVPTLGAPETSAPSPAEPAPPTPVAGSPTAAEDKEGGLPVVPAVVAGAVLFALVVMLVVAAARRGTHRE